MLKVLLVDDEINVVEGLKKSITWDKYGYNIPEVAFNGKDGLVKALEYKPDVIITDITMPVMDGIEMGRRIRESNPDVKLVFLTCHEDFNYVRDSLKLNAVEYLLKMTMTRDNLYDLLEKISIDIEAEKKKKEKRLQLSREINQNRYVISELIISDLIQGNTRKLDGVRERLEIYGYRLNKNRFSLSLLKLDRYMELIEHNIFDDLNLIKFAILNITEEILKRHDAGEVFANGNNEFIIIYNYDYDIKTSAIEKIKFISMELQLIIKKVIKNSCTIYIGNQYNSLENTPKAYEELKHLSNIRFYMKDEAIIEQRHNNMEYYSETLYFTELIRLFQEALEELDIERVEENIQHFVKRCYDLRSDINEVKDTFKKMFMVLTNFITKSGYGEQDMTLIPFSEILLYTDNIYGIGDILSELSKKALILTAKRGSCYSNNEITKIMQYIDNNLHEEITLDTVATFASMNASYFSRYFKTKIGENFVDYLARKRIEKAKKLLNETELTIEEIIGKVGHTNAAYFTRVFKKLTATTPGEYRSMHRERLKSINMKY